MGDIRLMLPCGEGGGQTLDSAGTMQTTAYTDVFGTSMTQTLGRPAATGPHMFVLIVDGFSAASRGSGPLAPSTNPNSSHGSAQHSHTISRAASDQGMPFPKPIISPIAPCKLERKWNLMPFVSQLPLWSL